MYAETIAHIIRCYDHHEAEEKWEREQKQVGRLCRPHALSIGKKCYAHHNEYSPGVYIRVESRQLAGGRILGEHARTANGPGFHFSTTTSIYRTPCLSDLLLNLYTIR